MITWDESLREKADGPHHKGGQRDPRLAGTRREGPTAHLPVSATPPSSQQHLRVPSPGTKTLCLSLHGMPAFKGQGASLWSPCEGMTRCRCCDCHVAQRLACTGRREGRSPTDTAEAHPPFTAARLSSPILQVRMATGWGPEGSCPWAGGSSVRSRASFTLSYPSASESASSWPAELSPVAWSSVPSLGRKHRGAGGDGRWDLVNQQRGFPG